MTIKRTAALIYTALTAGIVAFQIALALGEPWGEFAMGGAFPGQFPPALRIGAVVQALLLAVFALIVLVRAEMALPRWSNAAKRLIWLVVAFAAVSLILNVITPSARERAIWMPVALVLLASSVVTARSKA